MLLLGDPHSLTLANTTTSGQSGDLGDLLPSCAKSREWNTHLQRYGENAIARVPGDGPQKIPKIPNLTPTSS